MISLFDFHISVQINSNSQICLVFIEQQKANSHVLGRIRVVHNLDSILQAAVSLDITNVRVFDAIAMFLIAVSFLNLLKKSNRDLSCLFSSLHDRYMPFSSTL